MTTTTNHAMKKPEGTDNVNVADLNYNFDIIDNMPVIYRQSTEPTNKISGKTLWYDTTNEVLKLWNGSTWDEMGGGDEYLTLSSSEFDSALDDSDFVTAYLGSPSFFTDKWSYIVGSSTAMAAIIASTAGMAALADSVKAMDAVGASSTHRSSIWGSSGAWDAIEASDMASGKFVAGALGLTPSNFASMSAIALDSSTMDTVVSSTANLSIALAAYAYPIWKSPNSQKIWEAGTPVPPYEYTTYNGGQYSEIIDGPTASGKALRIKDYDGIHSGDHKWEISLDWTNIASLKIYTYHSRYSSSYSYIRIYLDGNQIYSSNASFGWTERTLNVSSYTGTKTLGLSLYNTNNVVTSSYYNNCYFGNIRLVRA